MYTSIFYYSNREGEMAVTFSAHLKLQLPFIDSEK